MRVIALFDGISTALYVLDKLGIQVEIYYSCEIDSNALRLQKYNYNDRIKMLGSVTTLTNDKLDSLGRVDLVLGGSPCNDLSLVNPRRRGLYGKQYSCYSFFSFIRRTFVENILLTMQSWQDLALQAAFSLNFTEFCHISQL